MKKYRSLSLVCAGLLLSVLLGSLRGLAQDSSQSSINIPLIFNPFGDNASTLSAAANAQIANQNQRGSERARLSVGSPVEEIISVVAPSDSVSAAQLNASLAVPAITFFYGNELSFGQNGNPQRWVNILGNVSPANNPVIIEYTLNSGPVLTTTVGPDRRRLALRGDFNAELDYTTLTDGLNHVVITATDRFGQTATEHVTITYSAGNQWPMPYTVDWSNATQLSDAGQAIDGLWELTGNGVRPVVHRYDRLVGFGDSSWENYEVEVPITIYGIDDANGYKFPSVGPGIGLIMNWSGHFQQTNESPTTGWQNFGAIAWHRWERRNDVDTAGLQGLIYNGAEGATDPSFQLAYNTEYIIKMRSENDANGDVLYSYKMWKSAEPEPANWNMQFPGDPNGPKNGSLLFVAHHVDAEYGDLQARSLAAAPPTPIVETPVVTPTVAFTPVPTATAVITNTATITPTAVPPTATPDATPTPIIPPPTAAPTETPTFVATGSPGSGVTTTPSAIPTQCWPLQTVNAGDGTAPVAEPANSNGCAAGSYLSGETIALSTMPDDGWAVHLWSGVDSGSVSGVTAVLTMPASSHWVGVTYAKQCYPLTLSASGSGSPLVASPASSTNCPLGEYVLDEPISLQAAADSGWSVGSWSDTDDDSSTASANSLIMPAAAHSVSVTYVQDGSGSPTSVATSNPTSNPTATSPAATPEPTVSVTVSPAPTPIEGEPLPDPVMACFVLTVEVQGDGSMPTLSPPNSVGCPAGSYRIGEIITFDAAPATAGAETTWTGTGDDSSTADVNSVAMPAELHTIVVSYGDSSTFGQEILPALYLPLIQ